MALILLDMDGPLAEFDKRCWEVITENEWVVDINHPGAQTQRYFTDHMLWPSQAKAMRKAINTEGWFASLDVTPGALQGVQALLDAGHELWVATKPLETNPTCRDEKAAWLRQHFPYLEDRLFIAPDKSLLVGDVLLDDAPKPKWFGRAQWEPVIFDAPYNGAGSPWANLRRWSWDQPIELLPRRQP